MLEQINSPIVGLSSVAFSNSAAAIANGYLTKNGEIRSNSIILDEKQPQKVSQKVSRKVSKIQVPEFPSKIVEDVFKVLKLNPKARLSWLADNLGVSEITVKRAISDLKELGYINSEHSKVKGVWQLLK
jgi:ATP-dependent DNA helicase RecG